MANQPIPTEADESASSNTSSSSPSLITYFVNVISGARQTASQEFGRFWENLEHHHHNIPTTNAVTDTGTDTSATRNIRTPRSSIKNKIDTSRLNKGEHINGRIIPDHYRRGYIKDAEIQTENFEVTTPPPPPPPSIVYKRKASDSLSSDYEYKTDHPSKKQARSVSPPTLYTSVKGKEADMTETMPTCLSPRIREVPFKYSLSTNTSPIRHQHHFQTRPATASPEQRRVTRDVMTGSKSVRRLTHELESSFIPRSPMSPYLNTQTSSPRQQQNQQDKSAADAELTKMDFSDDSPNDTTSPIPTRMEDIFPMIKPPPPQQQQRLTAKELDARMEKLEKEVGITKTKVSQFISPTTSLPPLNMMAYPVKSNNMTEECRTFNPSSTMASTTSSSKSFLPPPAPPPAPLLPTPSSPLRSVTVNSTPFSYTTSLSPVGSPLRESVRETIMAKKRNSELKPTDKHKEKMQVLIQMIPDVKLRKTNIIIGPDGVPRPNPYWHEIYRR